MRAPVADPRSLSAATHLGFDGAAPRHRMGLHRVEPGAWLEPDANRAWQLGLKAQLVAADRDRYVRAASTAAAERGVARLIELLADELGDDSLGSPIDGRDPGAGIEQCGLATQEDWCVMTREDTWRLRAACVCFPSRWVLAEKVGGTIAAIHGPVPRYDDELGGRVELFFDRLGPEQLVSRTNWNLWDDASLCQPFAEADAPVYDPPGVDEVADAVFLRVERQTLRRLTDDAIAFSIRVHQRPLAQVAEQEGALAKLRVALAGGGQAGFAPKKLGRLAEPVRAWLDSVDDHGAEAADR